MQSSSARFSALVTQPVVEFDPARGSAAIPQACLQAAWAVASPQSPEDAGRNLAWPADHRRGLEPLSTPGGHPHPRTPPHKGTAQAHSQLGQGLHGFKTSTHDHLRPPAAWLGAAHFTTSSAPLGVITSSVFAHLISRKWWQYLIRISLLMGLKAFLCMIWFLSFAYLCNFTYWDPYYFIWMLYVNLHLPQFRCFPFYWNTLILY